MYSRQVSLVWLVPVVVPVSLALVGVLVSQALVVVPVSLVLVGVLVSLVLVGVRVYCLSGQR